MNKKNHLDSLSSKVNGVKINGFDLQHTAEKLSKKTEGEKWEEERKEIIRRLRIQNKKLLEQVIVLKKRLKKMKTDKTKTGLKLNQLKKINKSISEALGSCPRCGERILEVISAGLTGHTGKK